MAAYVMSLVVRPIGGRGGGTCMIIGINSPPPFATLIGLLGMLTGENVIEVLLVAKS